MIEDFGGHLARHALLAGGGLAIGTALGAGAGCAAHARREARDACLGALLALRTVPSLAVLLLAVPLLGIGVRPALAALALLAAAPIAIATEAALRDVPSSLIEAARGLGLSEGAVRRRVVLPLAVPAALSGVRTAAVETIAGASLAAFIGGGGLGEYVVGGLAQGDDAQLGVGAASIALFALVCETALAAVQRRARRMIA